MSSPTSPLKRLLSYSRNYRVRFWRASIFSILNKVFDVAPEILIGVAVDVVVKREASWLAGWGIVDPSRQLLFLCVLTLLIWMLESLFEYLFSLEWRYLAQAVQHDLRMDAYRHVQNLDMSYFEDRSSGGLVSILNDDINQLERFLDGGANALWQVATAVVLVGGVFFYLAPEIALWAMLPIPVIVMGAFYFQKRAEPLYALVRERAGELSSRLTHNLGGIVTIKSQTAEAFEAKVLERESLAYSEANRRAIAVSSAFIPVIRMAILAGFIATLLVGGWRALDGLIEVGTYSVLVFLTQRLLWPLTTLAQTVDQYQRAMASTARVLGLLEVPIRVEAGQRKFLPKLGEGEIRVEGVSFSYGGRSSLFENLSLTFEKGKTTAIVGATGSGKSSLAKLLLRFYEPSRGKILLDGVPAEEFTLQSLRQAIGFVGQDVYLFDGTVRENIAFGRDGVSEEKVTWAAKAAEAEEFIRRLPHGYETIVGERGQKLSGGQRQRIALARAILNDPPILLLDEATSAVDNETERLIQKSLERLAVNRTMILIAHRLSTIRRADKIYVLKDGKVTEEGTHEKLLERAGLYAGLWSVQTGAT